MATNSNFLNFNSGGVILQGDAPFLYFNVLTNSAHATAYIKFENTQSSYTDYNWVMGPSIVTTGRFEIVGSTTGNGATYSNVYFKITGSTGDLSIAKQDTGTVSLLTDVAIGGGSVSGAVQLERSNSATVSVAAGNGSTGAMAFGSGCNGLLLITDQNSGKTCCILLSGASGGTLGTIISDPNSGYSTTAGAGKIGLTASGGTVTFTNQTGSALSIQAMLLRMV